MSANPALVVRLANAYRFQADIVEKVLRLKQCLVEFDRHPVLKGKLVLKGGTALNLFYLDLARLSVDIDLNYIGQVEREGMLAERPLIVGVIEQTCSALGYQVRRGTDDHALVTWTLGFRNQRGVAITFRSNSTSWIGFAPSQQECVRPEDSTMRPKARSLFCPWRNCWLANSRR